jgi:Spy/CpxP family protein refolding chaperone
MLARLGSALFALALFAAAQPASAFGACAGGMRPDRHLDMHLERHLEELGLEPAQLEAVRAILDESRGEREKRRETVRAAFEEMRALLDQDLPDEAAVMRQAEVLGDLRTEGHKAMLRTLLAVRAQLTPEQREALRERMRKDLAHGRERWKHQHGPGGGEGP